MAKRAKVRYGLEMSDGAKVRDIEELRKHADCKSVMKYFLNGKLGEWLADRNLLKEAADVTKISKSEHDAYKRICDVLKIEYRNEEQIDVKRIERMDELTLELQQVTDDGFVLKNIDKVVRTQKELDNLIEKGEKSIILYGKEFEIPNVEGITYKGVKRPKVILGEQIWKRIADGSIKFIDVLLPKDMKVESDLKNNQVIEKEKSLPYGGGDVTKQKVLPNNNIMPRGRFKTSYQFFEYIKERYGEEEAEAERNFFNNKHENIMAQFKRLKKQGIERANYFLAHIYLYGLGDAPADYEESTSCGFECERSSDTLARTQAAHLYGDEDTFNRLVDEIIGDVRYLADFGDPFACAEIYLLVMHGYKKISKDVAEKYAQFAMDLFYSRIYVIKGEYEMGRKNYNESYKLFVKASDLGDAIADYNLGIMYEKGHGVKKDRNQSAYYYKQAADKKLSVGLYALGEYYQEKGEYKEAFGFYKDAYDKGIEKAKKRMIEVAELGQKPQNNTLTNGIGGFISVFFK